MPRAPARYRPRDGMSARRVYDADGKPQWEKVDDGAVGRTTHTRGAITGGAIVVGLPQSKRDHQAEHARRKA
jgi:hypothetical protein